MRTDWRAVALLAWLTATAGAQEPAGEDTCRPDPTELTFIPTRDGPEGPDAHDIGWSNATELSIVRTQGNADTQTFGFKNTLRRNWTGARARLRVDGIRARASGVRFLVVAPGLRFRPGEQPEGFETSAARTDGPPDVKQYFVEGRFELNISERFFWNVGTSWDRNDDAGRRIAASYRRAGYAAETVAAESVVADESPTVDVRFDILEGPQQVLDAVVVEGARRTHPTLIDRALDLQPGASVDPLAWNPQAAVPDRGCSAAWTSSPASGAARTAGASRDRRR